MVTIKLKFIFLPGGLVGEGVLARAGKYYKPTVDAA